MAVLINVCSVGHSGSTMLDLMLGHADNAFSCGEMNAWFRPWRPHHLHLTCSCGKEPCPYWEQVKDYPERVIHRKIAETFGVEYVIDSSKELCWVVDNNFRARRLGMRVVNVLIWKDPVSYAYSHWKRHHHPDLWRKVFVEYHRALFQTGLPFVAVQYERLAREPAQTLQRLCQVIGMPYFPGKERFWEKEHHFLFGNGNLLRQLRSGQMSIRPRQSYPEAFQQEMPALVEAIRRDQAMQEILRTLRERDVEHGSYPQGLQGKGRRPRGCYLDWFKRRYRRWSLRLSSRGES